MSFLESLFRKFKRPDTMSVYREIIVDDQIKQLQATINALNNKLASQNTKGYLHTFDTETFLNLYRESITNNNIYEKEIDHLIGLLAEFAVENKMFPSDIGVSGLMANIKETKKRMRSTFNEMIKIRFPQKS